MTAGTQRRGHAISLEGPVGERNWRVALYVGILPQLDEQSASEQIAFIAWKDPRFSTSISKHPHSNTAIAYEGVPLGSLPAAARTSSLGEIVLAVDRRCHPGARLLDATGEPFSNKPEESRLRFEQANYWLSHAPHLRPVPAASFPQRESESFRCPRAEFCPALTELDLGIRE